MGWRATRRVETCDNDLEIGRHKGVVDNHHDVFVVLMDQVGADPDVNNLHHGVGGGLDPHQLHKERQAVGYANVRLNTLLRRRAK